MKLSIPVVLVVMAGIGKPDRNPKSFSPSIFCQQRSYMTTKTILRSGTMMRSCGHRWDAERRLDCGGGR
ncbi:hypothetical protein ACLB2K_053164 [Fragaria x ananassa]